MPQVYGECLGPALFAPFAVRVAQAAAARAPRHGCWNSPLAPESSPPSWCGRCRPPRSPRVTSTPPWWPRAPRRCRDRSGCRPTRSISTCPTTGSIWWPASSGRCSSPTSRRPSPRRRGCCVPGGTLLCTGWDDVDDLRLPGRHGRRPAGRAARRRRRTSSSGSRTATATRTGSPPTCGPAGWWSRQSNGSCCAAGPPRRGRWHAGSASARRCASRCRNAGSLPELTERLAAEMTARLGPGPVTGELAAFLVTARAPD